MAEIFGHADDLPVTPQDGTAAGIRIPSAHVEHLVYHAAQDAWVGRQHWTMRVYQNEGFTAAGDAGDWKYPGDAMENPATRAQPVTPYQFQIHKALHAGELWDAGLRLQEHLTGQLKPFDAGTGPSGAEVGQVALAWYPLADGDSFLSPDPSFNHGVRLTEGDSGDTENYRHYSSGWQNTTLGTPPAPDEHLYPEIYMLGPVTNLRELSARHRWAAGELGGAGSAEPAGWRPQDTLAGWYQAEQIYVADGQPVAEWGDWSGFGITLAQPSSGKRPTVMSESGIRFVRFDGSSDVLRSQPKTHIPGGGPYFNPGTPATVVYMVMRQRATGGTQQVWLGPNGAGAPLVYRGDATDQVNLWFGGSDATYDRGSAWPSPWMVWSMTLSAGGALSVWEGTTEVLDTTAGTTPFAGFCVGNNDAESLPAALDLAELIYSYVPPSDLERAAVVAHLEDKYGL